MIGVGAGGGVSCPCCLRDELDFRFGVERLRVWRAGFFVFLDVCWWLLDGRCLTLCDRAGRCGGASGLGGAGAGGLGAGGVGAGTRSGAMYGANGTTFVSWCVVGVVSLSSSDNDDILPVDGADGS